MCDRFPEERAVAMYQWSWGEKGYCSLKGQQMLNQQAKNLKQSVTYLPLVQAVPEPLRRDERQRLISEKLAAESETGDVLERNSKLYAQNTEFGSQLQQLKLRDEEATRQIADLRARELELEKGLSKASLENTKVVDELVKANLLLEAGPGEAETELASLRQQVERLEKSEMDLDGRLEESSTREGVVTAKLLNLLAKELRREGLGDVERALLETEIRKLKEG